ncbi:MAG: anti-anti-sigma factor [Bacteroidetes bacterium RIFCSPLOWO2_02_FULL_36_8]|nr:MAG: anti-anti-sigma factor [Bacteroidetes bacterium RIFCSPLOWO2_02_FULL_36_8]
MKFSIDKHEKYIIIKPEVEKLISPESTSLKSEIVQNNTAGFKNIIIDLSFIKYIDSSGLSALLLGNRLCKNQNGSFLITCPTEHVKKMIHISMLESTLTILPTNEEAIDMVFLEEIENDLLANEKEKEKGKKKKSQ